MWGRSFNTDEPVDFLLTLPHSLMTHIRSRWFTISTIIGATSMDQLQSNLATFGVGPSGAGGSYKGGVELSEGVLAAIAQVHLELRNPSLID